MAAFFLFGLGIGREEGTDKAIEERYDFSFRDSSYRFSASFSFVTTPFASQITEQINAKLLKSVEINPFYRMNLRQITEKTQDKLQKIKSFDHFCGCKCVDL